ncbi:MAG: hypothetical protein QXZ51_02970, partial [Candidatus Bathyarchaeia archaeon]
MSPGFAPLRSIKQSFSTMPKTERPKTRSDPGAGRRAAARLGGGADAAAEPALRADQPGGG